MVTIYNEKNKKLINLTGNPESLLRKICEENPKLFSKQSDDEYGKLRFTSYSSTEMKINIGNVYVWKNYMLEFIVG